MLVAFLQTFLVPDGHGSKKEVCFVLYQDSRKEGIRHGSALWDKRLWEVHTGFFIGTISYPRPLQLTCTSYFMGCHTISFEREMRFLLLNMTFNAMLDSIFCMCRGTGLESLQWYLPTLFDT